MCTWALSAASPEFAKSFFFCQNSASHSIRVQEEAMDDHRRNDVVNEEGGT